MACYLEKTQKSLKLTRNLEFSRNISPLVWKTELVYFCINTNSKHFEICYETFKGIPQKFKIGIGVYRTL